MKPKVVDEQNIDNQKFVDAFNAGVDLGKQYEDLRNKRIQVDDEIEEIESHLVSLKSRSDKLSEQIEVVLKEIEYHRIGFIS